MATHSSILAWRILWTEETGGLQSMGSQRVGHYWSDITWAHPSGTSSSFFPLSLPSLYEDQFVNQQKPREVSLAFEAEFFPEMWSFSVSVVPPRLLRKAYWWPLGWMSLIFLCQRCERIFLGFLTGEFGRIPAGKTQNCGGLPKTAAPKSSSLSH